MLRRSSQMFLLAFKERNIKDQVQIKVFFVIWMSGANGIIII